MCRPKNSNGVSEAEFSVPSLKCGSCAEKLKSSLQEVAGVREVQVKLPEKRVTVSFTQGEACPNKLKEVIAKAGFEVGA